MHNLEAQARQFARALLLQKLGNKCVVCDFDDYRALQVDHIKGDGYKDTIERGSIMYVLKILNDPDFSSKYQLLCANHNWIKRYENQEVRREAAPINTYASWDVVQAFVAENPGLHQLQICKALVHEFKPRRVRQTLLALEKEGLVFVRRGLKNAAFYFPNKEHNGSDR